MRYGVLADIHGNLPALQAALDVLRTRNVDRYLVAGDLVGYGPFPNECVDVIRELDAVCVAGNHDLIVTSRLPETRCSMLARTTLRWTQRVLVDEAREYLASLPLRAEANGGVVIAHGSLDDPEEYVTRSGQAAEQLARLQAEQPAARILILGHTHRPFAYDERGGRLSSSSRTPLTVGAHKLLLNPGAIGQSREMELRARARFALLDLERAHVHFYAVRYDLDRCRRELKRHGLPPQACHLRPSVKRAVPWAISRGAR